MCASRTMARFCAKSGPRYRRLTHTVVPWWALTDYREFPKGKRAPTSKTRCAKNCRFRQVGLQQRKTTRISPTASVTRKAHAKRAILRKKGDWRLSSATGMRNTNSRFRATVGPAKQCRIAGSVPWTPFNNICLPGHRRPGYSTKLLPGVFKRTGEHAALPWVNLASIPPATRTGVSGGLAPPKSRKLTGCRTARKLRGRFGAL